MNTNTERFEALVKLGIHLKKFTAQDSDFAELQNSIEKAKQANGWFTQASIELVLKSWGSALEKSAIQNWLRTYTLPVENPKKVALILAGNIPMVGFHDLICIWVSGHTAQVKCASKDKILLPYMTRFLERETGHSSFEYVEEPLTEYDAVIATGSNNAARYFEHYFGHCPNLIRKNRNGIAVLDGNETKQELEGLGSDILQYFGLGCRNVAKVYLPKDYDLNLLFGGLYPYSEVIQHAKYANNYDYNKAVFLMSEHDFLDNGFFIIKNDPAFSAPIGCLHYEYYTDLHELKEHVKTNQEKLQCIVSNLAIERAIPFGTAQQPALWDYADQVDTLEFLSDLN